MHTTNDQHPISNNTRASSTTGSRPFIVIKIIEQDPNLKANKTDESLSIPVRSFGQNHTPSDGPVTRSSVGGSVLANSRRTSKSYGSMRYPSFRSVFRSDDIFYFPFRSSPTTQPLQQLPPKFDNNE